jgi:predicted RNA-binding Zn-ribbon protein involved in translation (DUF1610 family)
MNEPRQKSIAVTPDEKTKLEAAKKKYENLTGEKADWGKFLGVMAMAGLAALGIYKIAKSTRANPVTDCPECGEQFSIAYADNLPPVVYVKCPSCGTELIVNMTQE